MIRLIFTIFCFTSIVLYGQNKTYSTVKISNWTLEKFPIHYRITPAKVYTERSPITGKLTYYQELNKYGKPEGLTITIQSDDYTSPASAYYYRNDATVYRAEFFSRSTKAYEIVNSNLNDERDGPQLTREYTDNRIQEKMVIYKDGKNLSVKEEPYVIHFDKDSLLTGNFKVFYNSSEGEYGEGYCIGNAENGELTDFLIHYNDPFNSTTWYNISDDFVHIKEFSSGESDTTFSIRPIYRKVKVTNSKTKIISTKKFYSINDFNNLKIRPDYIVKLMTDFH